jgi:hypothetical protein
MTFPMEPGSTGICNCGVPPRAGPRASRPHLVWSLFKLVIARDKGGLQNDGVRSGHYLDHLAWHFGKLQAAGRTPARSQFALVASCLQVSDRRRNRHSSARQRGPPHLVTSSCLDLLPSFRRVEGVHLVPHPSGCHTPSRLDNSQLASAGKS